LAEGHNGVGHDVERRACGSVYVPRKSWDRFLSQRGGGEGKTPGKYPLDQTARRVRKTSKGKRLAMARKKGVGEGKKVRTEERAGRKVNRDAASKYILKGMQVTILVHTESRGKEGKKM